MGKNGPKERRQQESTVGWICAYMYTYKDTYTEQINANVGPKPFRLCILQKNNAFSVRAAVWLGSGFA